MISFNDWTKENKKIATSAEPMSFSAWTENKNSGKTSIPKTNGEQGNRVLTSFNDWTKENKKIATSAEPMSFSAWTENKNSGKTSIPKTNGEQGNIKPAVIATIKDVNSVSKDKSDSEGGFSEGKVWTQVDKTYNELGNMAKAAYEQSGNIWDEDALRLNRLKNERGEVLDAMTENEKYTFINQADDKARNAYLKSIRNDLNKRLGEKEAAYVLGEGRETASPIGYAALAGVQNFGSGLKGMGNLLLGKEKEVTRSPLEHAYREIAPNLKGGEKVLSDLAFTTGNMLPSMALGLATGGSLLGTAAMGVSAAGSGYDEAIEEGYTAKQARRYGIASGVKEAALERFVGGLPGVSNAQSMLTKYLGKYGDNVLGAVMKNDGLRKGFENIIGKALSEGGEEYVQEVIEPWVRNLTLGENNEVKLLSKDAAYAGALGAVTGGLFAIPGGVSAAKDINKRVKINYDNFNSDILKSKTAARKNVIEFAKNNFPKSVIVESNGMEVSIRRNGLDKLLSGNFGKEKYATAFFVPDILRKAQETDYSEYKNPYGVPKDNIQGYTYMESDLDIGGSPYTAYIRIRHSNNKNNYYGHTIAKGVIDDIKIEPSVESRYASNASSSVNAIEPKGSARADIKNMSSLSEGSTEAPVGGAGSGQNLVPTVPHKESSNNIISSNVENINTVEKKLKVLDKSLSETADKKAGISDEEFEIIQAGYKEKESLRAKLEVVQKRAKLDPEEKKVADFVVNKLGGDTSKINFESISNKEGFEEYIKVKRELKATEDTLKELKGSVRNRRGYTLAGELFDRNEGFTHKKRFDNIKNALETPERIAERIFKDEKTSKFFKDNYIVTMKENEARATKFHNDIADKVKKLKLDNRKKYKLEILPFTSDGKRAKIAEEVEVTEGGLVQLYGEGIIGKAELKNIGADVDKVIKAAEEFKGIYDDLLYLLNKERTAYGYDPIAHRNNYFPHFEEIEPQTMVGKILNKIGMYEGDNELPVEIAGMTSEFKPGKQYESYSNKREGYRTKYDAIEGLDGYLRTAENVIFHTEDIQKFRALENTIRDRYSDESVKEAQKKILEDGTLKVEDKLEKINELHEATDKVLPPIVDYLRRYTNSLAGKKGMGLDRDLEFLFGRSMYKVAAKLENKAAASMVAGNISSAMTNFIPIAKVVATADGPSFVKAIYDTTVGRNNPADNLMEKSSFYTSRKGKDSIHKTAAGKVSEAMGLPFDFVDSFSSEVVVRSLYNSAIKKGMDEGAAIKYADEWAGKIMADRSYGAMPIVFYSKNPVAKLGTMFQVEVLNDIEHMFIDIPRKAKEDTSKSLAMMLLELVAGTFIFNEIYESFFGRRPSMDLLNTALNSYATLTGEEKENIIQAAGNWKLNGEDFEIFSGDIEAPTLSSAGKAVFEAGSDVVDSLPFISTITGGGRIPVMDIMPDYSDVSADNTIRENVKAVGHATAETLAKVASPVGGVNQVLKTGKGIKALMEGEVYGTDKDGNKKLKYAVDNNALDTLRAVIAGPTATSGGQDWVKGGFKSLSVKQTQNYYKAVEAGLSFPQYMTAIEAVKGIEGDKDEDGNTVYLSASEKKKAAIDEAVKEFNLTKKQKEVLYEANSISDKVW